jgi:hypothetical protein
LHTLIKPGGVIGPTINMVSQANVATTQNLGKAGDAVIELAGKLRKILTDGLL